MNIDGKISIFIGEKSTTIELIDISSNITFARIRLTPEQLSSALSRIAYTDCYIELVGLEDVGKTMQHKDFVFEIPDDLNRSIYAKELTKIAQSKLTDGWQAEGYFGSKGSFFVKNGKHYAKCIIRKWV